MIITIDGPVASGKSSVARLISFRHNLFYLYSGFLYRALSYLIIQKNIDPHSKDEVEKMLQNSLLEYKNDKDSYPQIFINQQNITSFLQSPEISDIASIISAYQCVREYVYSIQRTICSEHKNLIADGRDCGTYVFPEALVKIFLTASLEERAKRLCKRNNSSDINSCLEQIQIRDQRDTQKTLGSLKPAKDAFIIDNSNMTIEQTAARIESIVTFKRNNPF